jgi:sarcosine oxidase
MDRFHTIVVGLGAMGAATLVALARRGVRALGIDRFSPPHARGSSHGDTRITRLAIGEGVHYTPLAQRSHALWRELERETGASLLAQVGGLFISSARKSAMLHVPGFFDNTVAAARHYGIAHEILDATAIRRRFPIFNVADDEYGYFERDAGYLRPETCIAAELAVAEQRGAAILRDEPVAAIDFASDGVTVATARGRYAAERLVLAAGAWLPTLAASNLARHFRIYRQRMIWFEIDGDAALFRPGTCPVFIWELKQGTQGIYGFPAIDGPRGGVKIATEQFTTETTADTAETPLDADEVAAFHAEEIGPFVRGIAARCVRVESCLYTVTSDFGFVIDVHPESDRVLIVSACSGHGFKHSPAIGEAAAAWADEGRPPFDLPALCLGRFS